MIEPILKNIKIARISTVIFFVETQLRGQIQKIISSGACVSIISSEKNLIRPIPYSKYISIEIPRKINLIKDLLALFLLWKFFLISKVDIVHSTTPKAGLLCCIAGLLAGVKIRLHTFTGQPWVNSNGLVSSIAKLSDFLIARLSTHCYVDSRSQMKFLIDSGVVTENNSSVIGSGSLAGVDLVRFNTDSFTPTQVKNTRLELGISAATFTIIFIGRCTKDKGINELFSAFNILCQRGVDATLLVVGPFESDAQNIFDKIPPQVKNKIIFTGFTDCPERYIAVSDLLVLPSYREGFGTVVLEAAAMGVPSIASDIYGLRDAVVDKITGILVPLQEATILADTLLTLYEDPKLLVLLGQNARKRAYKHFSSDMLNNLQIEEYRKFLLKKNILKEKK
jgi:glycosyltransferase involved in cell wall biosynthesis